MIYRTVADALLEARQSVLLLVRQKLFPPSFLTHPANYSDTEQGKEECIDIDEVMMDTYFYRCSSFNNPSAKAFE